MGGFQYKIAGSENGSIVLMMGAKPSSDAWQGKATEAANVAFEVTKKFLLDSGIKITLAEPLSSGSLLAGYVITTDGDAYSERSKHTVNN